MKEATIKIIREAVREEVKATVNGRIEDLHRKMDELKPVLEAQRVVFSVSKFIKWGGPTVATLYALFRWFK